MIKDILVNLSVGKPKDVAGDFAVSAAALLRAHVTALAFAQEPPIGSPWDGVGGRIIDNYRAQQKAEAERALAAFESHARLSGIAYDGRSTAEVPVEAAALFGSMARHYDLSIVAQAQPQDDGAEAAIIEAALFDSGRPVLVVPYIHKTGLKLDAVAVCWDGSRSAARAVADALPLLRQAGRVDVLTVDTRERLNELPGAQIAEHLARHGLKVELKPLVAPDIDAHSAILSYAADNATDLIVMGGYGHSRLREFVLGGMTRNMLNSMTAPVLMSH